eukprot:4226882-Alexandrium_andersonii.AAC.1
MSASLVGSEMCIRDSSTTSTSSNTEPTEMLKRWRCVAPFMLSDPRDLGCCLLYTSDAADDM